ncbi:MAG: hypothetical protein WCJ70_03175 [bacterium]
MTEQTAKNWIRGGNVHGSHEVQLIALLAAECQIRADPILLLLAHMLSQATRENIQIAARLQVTRDHLVRVIQGGRKLTPRLQSDIQSLAREYYGQITKEHDRLKKCMQDLAHMNNIEIASMRNAHSEVWSKFVHTVHALRSEHSHIHLVWEGGFITRPTDIIQEEDHDDLLSAFIGLASTVLYDPKKLVIMRTTYSAAIAELSNRILAIECYNN